MVITIFCFWRMKGRVRLTLCQMTLLFVVVWYLPAFLGDTIFLLRRATTLATCGGFEMYDAWFVFFVDRWADDALTPTVLKGQEARKRVEAINDNEIQSFFVYPDFGFNVQLTGYQSTIWLFFVAFFVVSSAFRMGKGIIALKKVHTPGRLLRFLCLLRKA